MEEYVEKLKAHFTKIEDIDPEDSNVDDMMIEGDWWEFTNPKEVEAWSLKMIPLTDNMHFNMKYEKSKAYLPISFDEKVKRVSEEVYPNIKIHCATTNNAFPANQQYHFTLLINTSKIYFNISPFLEILEPTPYHTEIREMEKKVDAGEYQNLDGTPLTGKRLCTKITLLMNSFEVIKDKHIMQQSFLAARTVSVGTASQDEGQPSTEKKAGGSQSRGTRSMKPPPSPLTAPRSSPLASGSGRKATEKASEQSGLESVSYIGEMNTVPEALKTDQKPNYKVVSALYKDFWEKCSTAFIFGVGEKELPVEKLKDAPAEFNVRVKEDKIVKEMMHYLVNMPDKSTKQTLCVMPVLPRGTKDPPKNWEEVMDGTFYIINGQHSVAASNMMMQEDCNVSDEVKSHFKTWNCFVVWTLDKEMLRTISAYYNRTNHFQPASPSWATNLLGARTVWLAMGRPTPPKGDKTGGPQQRSKAQGVLTQKYKAFEKAINQRFAMIDVNKSFMLSKKKGADDRLKLTNELKIVSAPDDVYEVWSEVIVSAAHGELIDPETKMRFNEKENWKQESCALSRDFFRHLGNMTYVDLKKLAMHILNRSGLVRHHSYPKVTIKPVSAVLEDCYSTKDWVERVKRKKMVKTEIHLINPELNLFNTRNELIVENWRVFKRSRCFTSATVNLLLERPGEAYFSMGKQTRGKNKTAASIDARSAAFFIVFMEKKNQFRIPSSVAHMRAYNIKDNKHEKWPMDAWTPDTASMISLGVIDFRMIPGVLEKENSTIEKPFFYEVLMSQQKLKQPLLEEIQTWLFIVEDETDQSHVLSFVEKNKGLSSYNRSFAAYYPAKNERLYDLPANSAKALKKVPLIFLQSKDSASQTRVESEFRAPNTIVYNDMRKYNELPFRMYSMELRMEFYLGIIKKFCLPGSSVFSFFAGSKLTCAALMSSVDVFAAVPDCETDLWQNIATVGLSLDKDDFLDSSYAVDDVRFPTQRESRSTPESTRARTRSETAASPCGRRAKRPIEEVEEDEEVDEEDNEVEGEDIGGDVDGLVEFVTPGARMSQAILGSSSSSGLSTTEVQTVNADTPVSKNRPAKKMKKIDPIKTLSESLAYVLKQQEEMRREQQKDRETNMQFQMTSTRNFEGLAQALLEEQRMNREERQSNRIMWQEYLNKNQPQPLAALRPLSTSQQFQIGLNPSGSNDSAASDAQAASQEETREEQQSDSGNNLPVDPNEVVPGSGIDRANDPPAGLRDMQNVPPTHVASVAPSFPILHPEFVIVDGIPVRTSPRSESKKVFRSPILPEEGLDVSEIPAESSQRQGSGPPSGRGGTSEGVVRPFRSMGAEKWINVVLDLNGILCVCEDWKSKGLSHKKLRDFSQPHSAIEPALVGPKAVWVRPHCSNFLSELGKFAFVSVWSSMKKSTTDMISQYLFRDNVLPFQILGQDSCQTLKQRERFGRLTSFKVPGTDKDLFLKNLDKLFKGSRGTFSSDNTVIVDDSPMTQIMNKPENVILPDSWSYRGTGPRDSFLLDVLLPWFQRLHIARDQGFKAFKENGPGRIGRRMLCDDRNRKEYDKLMEAVRTSSSLS